MQLKEENFEKSKRNEVEQNYDLNGLMTSSAKLVNLKTTLDINGAIGIIFLGMVGILTLAMLLIHLSLVQTHNLYSRQFVYA